MAEAPQRPSLQRAAPQRQKTNEMSLRPFVPALVVALALSVAAMVYGASTDDRVTTATAAALFAGLVVAVALMVNARYWRAPGNAETGAGPSAVRRNVRLAALVYAWGAAAMLAVYTVSGLSWRHGWQYGSLMALIAGAFAVYVARMDTAAGAPMPPLTRTLLHGLAAAGCLVYLVGTGKLSTTKSDWAANDVFLFGGLAILVLCAVSALTETRLVRRG